MSAPDKQPAFPMGNPEQGGYDGMDLRDYFAGQALAGIATNPAGAPPSEYASIAYTIADAMLAHRTQSEKTS